MKKRLHYIPNIKFNKYAYIGIAVFFVLLLVGLNRQKNAGIKIGNTMLIMGNYDETIKISSGDKADIEAGIQKYDEMLNDFAINTGKDLGNRTNAQLARFIDKATKLTLLGQNNQAIKTLNKAFEYFPESPYIFDALGGIYAQRGAYQYAIDNYKKIIAIDSGSALAYAKPIMEMYVGLKDADTAGKQYIEYIKNGGQSDAELINKIRALRKLDPLK